MSLRIPACFGVSFLLAGAMVIPAVGQTRSTFGTPGTTNAAAANQQADRQAVLTQRSNEQREGVRGVREQDEAARRTSNQ